MRLIPETSHFDDEDINSILELSQQMAALAMALGLASTETAVIMGM